MTRPKAGSTARAVLAGLVVLAVAGGCAQPGQLGHEPDATALAAPSVPPAPGPGAAPSAPSDVPATPGPDVRGTVDGRVRISAPGPSELLVRTETLAPGQSSGWITHPGTVLSVVRSGTVTVVRRGACTPAVFEPSSGFFVPDAEPYVMRNDGPAPVVLTRSELLAPGADERRPAAPACSSI